MTIVAEPQGAKYKTGFINARRRTIRDFLVSGAILSWVAALIHVVIVPEHLAEWWGYGFFFVIVAAAQGSYGVFLALELHRWDSTSASRHGGSTPDEQAQWVYMLGIVGNAALICLYVVTRTLGIPFLGPEAGEVEPVTSLGLVSATIEMALVGVLAVMLRFPK